MDSQRQEGGPKEARGREASPPWGGSSCPGAETRQGSPETWLNHEPWRCVLECVWQAEGVGMVVSDCGGGI